MQRPDYLALMPNLSRMTDEEWEEHDRWVMESRKPSQEYIEPTAEEQLYRRLEVRGVPLRLVRAIQGEQKETQVLKAVEGLGHDLGVVVLSGPVGCGKSYAAALWLAQASKAKGSVLMVTASWFARQSRYSSEDGDKFEELGRPDFLVIDDLGVEYADAKGSFNADLDELLSIRYNALKPTLITTNLAQKDFKVRYSVRVVDRIRDGGKWIAVAEPSLRGKA